MDYSNLNYFNYFCVVIYEPLYLYKMSKKEHPLGEQKFHQLLAETQQSESRLREESSGEEWQPRKQQRFSKGSPPLSREGSPQLFSSSSSGSSPSVISDTASDSNSRRQQQDHQEQGHSSPSRSPSSSDSDEPLSDTSQAKPESPLTSSSSDEPPEPSRKRPCPKGVRRQMPCPVRGCRWHIQNVRRHMVVHHNYTPTKAKRVFTRLAERYRKTTPKNPLQQCPMCPSRVVRLDNHQKYHCAASKEARGAPPLPTPQESLEDTTTPQEGTTKRTPKRPRHMNVKPSTDIKARMDDLAAFLGGFDGCNLSDSTVAQYSNYS